jgi:hypothetical protein
MQLRLTCGVHVVPNINAIGLTQQYEELLRVTTVLYHPFLELRRLQDFQSPVRGDDLTKWKVARALGNHSP